MTGPLNDPQCQKRRKGGDKCQAYSKCARHGQKIFKRLLSFKHLNLPSSLHYPVKKARRTKNYSNRLRRETAHTCQFLSVYTSVQVLTVEKCRPTTTKTRRQKWSPVGRTRGSASQTKNQTVDLTGKRTGTSTSQVKAVRQENADNLKCSNVKMGNI